MLNGYIRLPDGCSIFPELVCGWDPNITTSSEKKISEQLEPVVHVAFPKLNKKHVGSIDLITDSDAILKILSVDFCGKVKVNSDSSFKTV